MFSEGWDLQVGAKSPPDPHLDATGHHFYVFFRGVVFDDAFLGSEADQGIHRVTTFWRPGLTRETLTKVKVSS